MANEAPSLGSDHALVIAMAFDGMLVTSAFLAGVMLVLRVSAGAAAPPLWHVAAAMGIALLQAALTVWVRPRVLSMSVHVDVPEA